MLLDARIRKIREIRGLKQSTIAQSLNVTQQAYSYFENNPNNSRVETLQKFCEVVNLPLSFLVDTQIPVNEENLNFFSRTSSLDLLNDYRNLKQRCEVYEQLLNSKTVNFRPDLSPISIAV